MQVLVVPCLRDNYAYLVVSANGSEAVVVDPSEAAPVLKALSEHKLTLKAILNTHHHRDHVGGNSELIQKFRPMPVYAHASDKGRIPEQNRFLEDGDKFTELKLEFQVLYIPGHTLGAIAYVCEGCAFTGDTLFSAGCGRMFEGTPEMMHRSINECLGALPDETLIYCGHEYTEHGLKFARSVEPGNAEVEREIQRVATLRSQGWPTIPSTLAKERQINPFLRCQSPSILASMASRLNGSRDSVAVFGALRLAKDVF